MHPDNRSAPGESKRIAIFYPSANLGAFSSLRDTLALLVELGYRVDFYTTLDAFYPRSDLDLQGLSIINRSEAFLYFTETYPKLILRLKKGGKPYRWLMMNVLHPLLRTLSFNNFLRQRHASHPYGCIIGIDPEGLTSAAPLAKILNIPLAYWSLELLFASEITKQEQKKRLKSQEITGSRQAIFTIVQDRWRGQALIDENGLEPSKIFYVPNAPRGKARREKSDYIHRRLNISPERKVVLCAGSIARWSMAAEIVAAAVDWPDDYVLVMQSRKYQIGHPDEYWNDLIKMVDPKKVIISSDPVPQSEFRRFVDSADVGLAFYTPAPLQNTTAFGKNISLIGLSSGKIAGYLHSGLPIIVNDAVIGPGELVKTTQCGICVEKPEEIKDALASIFGQYDWYTANACRCFDQEMELERHFGSVIEQMEIHNGRKYNTATKRTL